MSTPRTVLRQYLNKMLVPKLLEIGFVGENIRGNARGYEFIRERDGGKQLFLIIFNKYGKGKCYFQLEMELKLEKLEKGRKFKVGHIYKHTTFGRSFEFRSELTLIDKILNQTHQANAYKDVSFIANIIPEIDNWWSELNGTSHISSSIVHHSKGT